MTRKRDKKTYTITFPLKTNSAQEYRLDRMYKAGCLLQNKIIEEVQKRHRKIILETSYNDLLKELRGIPKQIDELKEKAKETKDKSIKATLKEDVKTLSCRKTEINMELNALRKECGLTEFGLGVIGCDLRKKHGLTKLIDSEQAQVIAGNVWSSYEKFLFSGAKMHFRKRRDFNFLRNKTNATGFKYRSGVNSIVHKELGYIPIIIEENNQFELQALSQTVKYCGIKRVYFGKKKRYYVVITIAGYYPEVFDRKHGQNIGEVGIDVGTSSVAFASEKEVGIVPLNPHWKEYDKKLKEISRKMERSLRQNNPDCYNEKGEAIKGKHPKKSNRYKKLQAEYNRINQKMIRQRDIYQNELANKLYSLGDTLITEKGNVKGLQKKSKKTEKSDSTVVTKSGKEVLKNKKKKRFGSSIKSNAPATFVQKLKKKQELNDRIFHEVDSKVNKASQYHHDTGEYVKSRLNERRKTVDDQLVQRDMYSAFLLRNTDLDTDLINPEKCMGDFDSFIDNQSEAIKELSNKHISKELMAIIGKEVLDIKNKIS